MRSTSHKRFKISAYYIFKGTFPYGIFDIILSILEQLVTRIVFVLLLLKIFKDFAKHVDHSLATVETGMSLIPLLLAVLISIFVPSIIHILRDANRIKHDASINDELLKRYCFAVFGSSKITNKWKKYYKAQKRVFEFYLLQISIGSIFLIYDWRILAAYLVTSKLFIHLGIHKFKSLKVFSIQIDITNYISFVANLCLGIYLLLCAVIIALSTSDFPIEFIFILVVGARMLFSKGISIIKFLRTELGKE